MFTSCLLKFINFKTVIFHNTAHDRPSCEPNLLLSSVLCKYNKQKSACIRFTHTLKTATSLHMYRVNYIIYPPIIYVCGV